MISRWLLLIVCLFVSRPLMAQDDDVPLELETNPDFGRVLLEVEIPMEDNDFLLAKHLAVQPDLSRIYVGSGAAGIVLVLDDKGNQIDQVDIFYEAPVNDMAVGPDGNLYVVQFNKLFVYDPDGRQIAELAGDVLNGLSFDRVVPAPDKTLYLVDVFSDKDRLYHLDENGEELFASEHGYLSNITGDDPSIFDEFRLGQDGLLYYFSNEAKQMIQMDNSFEVLNIYSNLITSNTGTQRTGMLIDEVGRVLFGDRGEVEIYGDKEELVYSMKLASEFEFVHDIAFAEHGQLVVLQDTQLTVLQYGVRDK